MHCLHARMIKLSNGRPSMMGTLVIFSHLGGRDGRIRSVGYNKTMFKTKTKTRWLQRNGPVLKGNDHQGLRWCKSFDMKVITA